MLQTLLYYIKMYPRKWPNQITNQSSKWDNNEYREQNLYTSYNESYMLRKTL